MSISDRVLIEIQQLYNSFVWDQKKPQIQTAILQKGKKETGSGIIECDLILPGCINGADVVMVEFRRRTLLGN